LIFDLRASRLGRVLIKRPWCPRNRLRYTCPLSGPSGRGRDDEATRPPPPPRPQLATRWLLGELDAHVALPVRLVCDALGLAATRLAATVALGARSVAVDCLLRPDRGLLVCGAH